MKTVAKLIIGVRFMVISSQDAEDSSQDAENSSQDAEYSSQDALYVHASVHMSCNYIYFCTGLNVKVLPSLVRHMVW